MIVILGHFSHSCLQKNECTQIVEHLFQNHRKKRGYKSPDIKVIQTIGEYIYYLDDS